MSRERVYLKVPFAQKEEAKRLGARWCQPPTTSAMYDGNTRQAPRVKYEQTQHYQIVIYSLLQSLFLHSKKSLCFPDR